MAPRRPRAPPRLNLVRYMVFFHNVKLKHVPSAPFQISEHMLVKMSWGLPAQTTSLFYILTSLRTGVALCS